MGTRAEEFGPYLVYEQIGSGGMASVHRAETQGIEGFKRPIALKRMLPHVAQDAALVASFVREARLASHLRHENVAQTYELGKVGDVYFMAMELVAGHNVRELLNHCLKARAPMPVPIALNILNQLCDALDYAHNLCDDTGTPLKIIHRDVSPSNLIVSEGSGVLKLIDFGIAKASGGIPTLDGVVKGKYSYMAPEYIAGRLDARADLFAVGVIAHELLSNRPLFRGRDDMDTLARVKTMAIQPPSHKNPLVPREVDEIVMTALARDPDKRWQHATALRTAMTTVTKRLGLVTMNTQVVEWIASEFTTDDARDPGMSQATVPRLSTDPRWHAPASAGEPDPHAAVTKLDRPRAGGPDEITRATPEWAPEPPIPEPADPPLRKMQRTREGWAAASELKETPVQRPRPRIEQPSSHSSETETAEPARSRERWGLRLALLLVLAVVGTATVVYFALTSFS